MLIRNDLLYVANAGGFSVDNTIAVIDTDTDEVIEKIEVGVNPSNLEMDGSGNIWVLGRGNLAFDADFNLVVEESTPGFLSLLNTSNAIEVTFELTEITFSAADHLVISKAGDRLYFNYNGGVWTFDTNDVTPSSEPFINKSLYGLSLDSTTDNLIGTEAPDFSSGGNMIFFDNTGAVVNTFTVGIGPNSAIFKD